MVDSTNFKTKPQPPDPDDTTSDVAERNKRGT